MATHPYLVLTDDSSYTITIQDGTGALTNYMPNKSGWAPKIAGLRDSFLAGHGPYNEALEDIEISIRDTSAANCHSKLLLLVQALEYAKRWARGEYPALAPLQIKYIPAGSAKAISDPLKADILDVNLGSEELLGLPVQFDETSYTFFIDPIRLRLLRRGLWLYTVSSDSDLARSSGDLMTWDFLAAPSFPSPHKIRLSGYPMGDPASSYQNGYIAIGDGPNDIGILDAESLAAGAPYTSIDNSSAFARNTNVLRYSPTVTTEVGTGDTAIAFETNSRLIAVYANIRNNSSSTSFKLRIRLLADRYHYTDYLPIAPFSGSAFPLWYHVGTLAVAKAVTSIAVYWTASAATGNIDIDSIVLVNLSKPQNRVIKIIQTNDQSGLQNLDLDHRWLSQPEPWVLWNASYPRSYEGDPAVFLASNLGLVLSMQTGGASTSNRWRAESGGTVLTHILTVTRYLGFLSPT